MWRIDAYSARMPFAPRRRRASPEMNAEKLALYELGQHLSQSLLLQLESRDRLSEHHSVAGISERFLIARLRRSHRAPRDAITSLGQAHERALDAARLWEQRRSRHSHILYHQLARIGGAERKLAPLILGRESRRVSWNDEAADRLVTLVVSRLGPDDRDLRGGSVGDPHLRAVDDPASIFLHESTGDHPRRIRPIIGFGQSEASNYLAAGHFRQIVAFLLLSTESVDRIHHQRALHGGERAHTR